MTKDQAKTLRLRFEKHLLHDEPLKHRIIPFADTKWIATEDALEKRLGDGVLRVTDKEITIFNRQFEGSSFRTALS